MCEEKMKGYNVINYTLIFIRNNSKVLLGLKKRGLGVNKYNGFGGKVKSNETLLQGVLRELKEESDLTTSQLKHIGVCFYNVIDKKRIDLVHVFTSDEYIGTPKESDEMVPQWFHVVDIPYEQMWPDAKHWHPYMLEDKHFLTYVDYTDENTIAHQRIKQYESIASVLKQVDHLKNNFLPKLNDNV